MLWATHIGGCGHRRSLLHPAEEGSITCPLIYNHRLTMLVYIAHSLLATLRCCLRVVMAHRDSWGLVGRVVQPGVSLDVVLLVHV